MTDWVKDLQDLLGNIVGPENSPLDELAAGNFGGAATAPLTAAFNVAQAPLEFVQNDLVGEGIMGTGAMLQNLTPFATDATRRRQELAMQGRGGEIWDEWIEDKPAPVKVALELGMDPLNIVGGGLVRGAASQLRHAADIPRLANRAGDLAATASVLELGNAFNDAPLRAAQAIGRTPLAQGTKGAVKSGIERVVPNAFELSPKSRVQRRVSDIITARQVQRAMSRRLSSSMFTSAGVWYPPVGILTNPVDGSDILSQVCVDRSLSRRGV